ncbi:Low molecular weight protein-tyrosine-phosphatase YfkJ [compost metagenome]
MKPVSILFVCMGNICRSPLAEGIFTHVAETAQKPHRFHVDSAGTGDWHAGNQPDPRSVEIAAQHGIDISGQRARQVKKDDFERFDLILCMDEDNLSRIMGSCPPGLRHKVHLFSQYASGTRTNVPDPYYGGKDGFLIVYNMLFAGCRSLLEKIDADGDVS